jgi:hypothetical protein
MLIAYLENLSPASLKALKGSGKRFDKVFYFGPDKGPVKRGGIEILPLQFHLADLRNEKGENQFIKITSDIKDLTFKIRKEKLEQNIFLRVIGEKFDFARLMWYFAKVVFADIHESVVSLNAAKWHAFNFNGRNDTEIVFFLSGSLWGTYLEEYAGSLGISLVSYKGKPRNICKELAIIWLAGKFPVKGRLPGSKKRADKASGNPLLAAWYTGQSVTFDPGKRSAFLWLLGSGIPHEQVLIYFNRTDVLATQEKTEALGREGINSLVLSRKAAEKKEGINFWSPGISWISRIRYLRLLSDAVKKAENQPVDSFYISNMLDFIKHFAYWKDFFDSQNIKVHVSANDFSRYYAAKNLALEKSGGVSVSYQFSNLWFSSVEMSNCSDVYFSFSKKYHEIIKASRPLIGDMVNYGYISDRSFREVRNDSLKLREKLKSSGAEFIICYFDENSTANDKPMCPISDKGAVKIYRYFLELVLSDLTVGVIFKPGYPGTLNKRIAVLNELIEKAKATGRCVFMMDSGDCFATEQYPAEAAQAADLCVGLLLSGTVALESFLCGVKTVFLDLEKLYMNEVYQYGKDMIVFDEIEKLDQAIRTFRKDPQCLQGFGDLNVWAKGRDDFRDGKASERMGQYLDWLMESFGQGKDREEALAFANQRYRECWGQESVVNLKGN